MRLYALRAMLVSHLAVLAPANSMYCLFCSTNDCFFLPSMSDKINTHHVIPSVAWFTSDKAQFDPLMIQEGGGEGVPAF